MHGMDPYPGSSAFLQALIFMMFSGDWQPFPREASEMSSCGMVFLERWFSLPSTNSQRSAAVRTFFVWKWFGWRWDKNKLDLSLLSQVKQRLIAAFKDLRETGFCKAEGKAKRRTKKYKQASAIYHLQINRFLSRGRMRVWSCFPVGTEAARGLRRFKKENKQLMKEIKWHDWKMQRETGFVGVRSSFQAYEKFFFNFKNKKNWVNYFTLSTSPFWMKVSCIMSVQITNEKWFKIHILPLFWVPGCRFKKTPLQLLDQGWWCSSAFNVFRTIKALEKCLLLLP